MDGTGFLVLTLIAIVIGMVIQYEIMKAAVKNGTLAAHDRINGTNHVTPRNVKKRLLDNPSELG